MSDYTNYTTLSGSSGTITLVPTVNHERPKTPAGLIVTQAVQTKDGWLGQVIVDKQIVWQSDPKSSGDHAIEEANTRVVDRIRAWFVDDDDERDRRDRPRR